MNVMKFEIKGEPMTLVGDSSLVRSKIFLKAMWRVLRRGGIRYLMECNQMEAQKNMENAKDGCEMVEPYFLRENSFKNTPRFLRSGRGCHRPEFIIILSHSSNIAIFLG